MFQFYNSHVATNTEKIKNEIDNVEIKLNEFVYNEFLNFLNTGKILNYYEFKNKLKIDFEKYRESVVKTLEEQKQKNKENFITQMENRGMTPSKEHIDKDVNISNLLLSINEALSVDVYQKYQLVIQKFKAGINDL